MKNIIILTSSFPYEGGEQFLETEIEYWKNSTFDNIYIIPASCKGRIREYPDNIKVIDIKNNKSKIYYVLLSLCSSVFLKEILYIIKNRGKYNFLNDIKSALRTTALTLRSRDILKNSLKSVMEGENTVYSYWNDAIFYSACILKEEGIIKNIISRAHGYDLYEKRRVNSYMPLKRQFMDGFDKIYLLSKNALNYYGRNYNANINRLEVSRLGVDMPFSNPAIKLQENRTSILSLSYCVEVKQIHKIIDAVYQYAKINSDLVVEWTHIGGGPLYNDLKTEADKLTTLQENLKIGFIGNLKNSEVKKKLEENYFDVFINTSKSEGIPVSIMEAMSHGIPAIAPDVGEISDLVNDTNGCLMQSDFTIDDIVEGIDSIINNEEHQSYRKNAKIWVEENFNSDLNYPAFVIQVEKTAGINDSK